MKALICTAERVRYASRSAAGQSIPRESWIGGLVRKTADVVSRIRQATVRRAFAVAVMSMTLTGVAFGQGQDASIIGQVKDDSGAVLPGVTVTATSPALQVAD